MIKPAYPLLKKIVFKGTKIGFVDGLKTKITCEIRLIEPSGQRNYETLEVIDVPYYEVIIVGSNESSGGQMYMSSVNVSNNLKEIFMIWPHYHLNTMITGTKKQMEYLGSDWEYTEACERLNNLYEDRGYRFGNDWLVNVLTNDQINYIKGLFT
jgi:hypothetical protein